jgi:methyltransferase
LTPALIAFLAALIVQRGVELTVSARNAVRIRARGGVEHGRDHFPLLVLLHTLFPVLLILEVTTGGARPGPAWPAWFALWIGAQLLRYVAMRTLGDFWNVRIWVVPGEPPVRSGIYRFLRHPNYVAVVLELVAAPMMFGAWRTAAVISVVNALALSVRIRAEERALEEAACDPS